MSKKVVHLSDDAHELAKAYCKDSGMKMSDWVAMLIKRAVEPAPVVAPPPPPPPPAPIVREAPRMISSEMHAPRFNEASVNSLGPKKKPMLRELSSEKSEDAVPVYAQPPFWARAKTS